MPKIDLKKAEKIYFIGIGGIGMSAVARMFLIEHKEVFGSDLSSSEVTNELEKLGAKIRIGEPSEKRQNDGFLGNGLPAGIDLVVYTVAIPENHPELVDARNKKIATISYPETLGLISKDKFTIAVAGTHGKTTTTGMIAQILIEAGLDPTVIIGSFLVNQKRNDEKRDDEQDEQEGGRQSTGQKSNFIAGKSKYLVVEACEYKRSFLNLKPDVAVITNIDDDHLDYYKNLAGVQTGFRDFVGQVKSGGTIVTDVDNEKIRPVLKGLDNPKSQKNANNIGNNLDKNITKIQNVIDYNSIGSGSNSNDGEKITLKIPGRHNIQNAKAALAVALALGVPEEKAIKSLGNFSGTWRRFEEKGKMANGALVYDDYAHHPSEIAATLQAAREKFPKEKIIVAFQPHLYSRTKEHFDEFGPALALADEIIILQIYAAREPIDASLSSEILTEEIKKELSLAQNLQSAQNPQLKGKTQKVSFSKDFESAGEYLKKHLKPGDVLFTMGAGDIAKLAGMTLS